MNISREDIITRTSLLGIAINVVLAVLKIVTGVLASSIAIISEGTNSAADAMSSILTLIGTKLAGKKPDKKHPFGYGRLEYMTGVVISVVILVAGIEMLSDSVKSIFEPSDLNISNISLIIVAGSAVIKYILGTYTIKMGKKAGSAALEAVGIEGRNDCFISIVTIISAAVFLLFGVSVDAYAGTITSLFIIKAGADVLRDTVADLLGRPGEKELADKLYAEIRKTEGIVFAADMMLHNYGPDEWSGSVNIEIDHKKTVGDVYEFLHRLQLRIMHEYRVTMVFGIYAVDNDNPQTKEMRKVIAHFVTSTEHLKSFHALYIDKESDKVYCDFIVDYDLKDWEALRDKFTSYMKEHYPQYELELVIETEFV